MRNCVCYFVEYDCYFRDGFLCSNSHIGIDIGARLKEYHLKAFLHAVLNVKEFFALY